MSTQPTAEQQKLLDGLVRTATAELQAGSTPATVLDGLVQRGLTEALARKIVDRARNGLGESSGVFSAVSDLTRHVFIVRLPPDADPSEVVGAPPMGTREEVIAHVAHVLPGISFDDDGRGRFGKSGFSLEFELGAEAEVSLVDLAITGGGGALSAIKRLSHRTGWRVLDRSEDRLFDLPGGEPHLDPEPPPAPPPPGREAPRAAEVVAVPTPRPLAPPRRSPLKVALAATFLVAVSAAAIVLALRPRGIDANEGRALEDLVEFARVQGEFAALNMGGFVGPEVLADPSRYATLLGTGSPLGGLSDRGFDQATRNGYRFEFRPTPGSASSDALVGPAYTSFAYMALPEVHGETGRRSFAYLSDQRAVFARDDGRPPTPDDRVVALLD